MAVSKNKLPIQRIDSSIKLSEITHGDSSWKSSVDWLAATHTRPLIDLPVAQQQATSEATVGYITGGSMTNAQELVDASESNPNDLSVQYKREGLAQSLALALLTKAHDTADQFLVDALCSGDVTQVEAILPMGMEPMAQSVAEVMLPNEIVDQVTRLNRTLSTPGSSERDIKMIDGVVSEISRMVEQTQLTEDDIHVVIARGVVEKLQRRIDVLSNPPPASIEGNEEAYVYRSNQTKEFPPNVETADKTVDVILDMIEKSEKMSFEAFELQPYRAWLLMLSKEDGTKWFENGVPVDHRELSLKIEARLALDDTSKLMERNKGKIRENGGVLGVVSRIASDGILLTNEHLAYLMRELKNNVTGIMDSKLPTGQAWDLFQESNTDYQRMLDDMIIFEGGSLGSDRIIRNDVDNIVARSPSLGNRFTSYYLEGDSSVRDRVYKYFVKKILADNTSVSEKDAIKAVELARKAMWAIGEMSVIGNLTYADGDNYSEKCHFYEFITDENSKGKTPVDPMLKKVFEDKKWNALTPGFLRFACGSVKGDPNTDVYKPIYHNNLGRPADSLHIKYENLTGKFNWETYHAVILCGKINSLSALLCDQKGLDPAKDNGSTYFANINDLFSKADPYDKWKSMRMLVAGIILRNSVGDSRTRWTNVDVNRFYSACLSPMTMTKDEIEFWKQESISAGKELLKRTTSSFLTKEQLDWIKYEVQPKLYTTLWSFSKSFENAIQNIKIK